MRALVCVSDNLIKVATRALLAAERDLTVIGGLAPSAFADGPGAARGTVLRVPGRGGCYGDGRRSGSPGRSRMMSSTTAVMRLATASQPHMTCRSDSCTTQRPGLKMPVP